MSRNRIILVTAGIMLSLFLASMESTVVATAMPTIVGQLGGLEHYSWVFSAFHAGFHNHRSTLRKTLRYLWPPQVICQCHGALPDRLSLCGWANSMTQLILRPRIAGHRRGRHHAAGFYFDRRDVLA